MAAARSFSTFVAAVVRTLVGFYDISYADGLAVCGATAREMLTYGERAGIVLVTC